MLNEDVRSETSAKSRGDAQGCPPAGTPSASHYPENLFAPKLKQILDTRFRDRFWALAAFLRASSVVIK